MQFFPGLMTAAGSVVNAALHFGRRLSEPLILTLASLEAMTLHILTANRARIKKKKTKQNLTLRNHVLTTSSDRSSASFDTRGSFLGPPVTLCSTFYVLALASLPFCVMYIPYLSDTACGGGILFRAALGTFSCAPLRISHCLDSLGKRPRAHF